ncbi:MAG: diguanylate cyclase [Lachnospiraceae bacterium]|nr:diguanylate cyclase [Lachnospiraceae bacterium]
MKPLKEIISRYMNLVTLILLSFFTIVIIYFQVADTHRQAYKDATVTIQQIEQVLEQNNAELTETMEEYRQTCLYSAEAIAYLIQNNPSVLDSIDELRRIAVFMEVDEIHIFDETGRIFAGTHPEYYNFTFDSGEQMMFFKPMLTDKSLKLVQDITPNVAEAKLMQYSALWSADKKFIVQVGMSPDNVMKATKKNELSYIFSLFRVNPEASYYAIDKTSGEIIGSSDLDYLHKNVTAIGLNLEDISSHSKGFHALVNGQDSFCIFQSIDSNYIGRIVSNRVLYEWILLNTLVLLICLIIIALVLTRAVTAYMNRYVLDDIYRINKKLHAIAAGNLDEIIDIQSSIEFSALSSDINRMKQRLLDDNRKMSYVLSKTNMYIGVYEYNGQMPRVRFTEYVPKILNLTPEKAKQLSGNYQMFHEFLSQLRSHPISNETNVFKLEERYIKIEEISKNNNVFGILIDVTEDTLKRLQIEQERDYDHMTGLYNRRGLENFLASCFLKPEEFRESAVVMIDADNLKVMNDTYGHEGGDAYLRQLAGLLKKFEPDHSVAARLGGDEFVLFLYQYQTIEALSHAILGLEELQNNSQASLNNGLLVPLSFSFGYCLSEGHTDYQSLLKEADEKMYENKKNRKSGRS